LIVVERHPSNQNEKQTRRVVEMRDVAATTTTTQQHASRQRERCGFGRLSVGELLLFEGLTHTFPAWWGSRRGCNNTTTKPHNHTTTQQHSNTTSSRLQQHNNTTTQQHNNAATQQHNNPTSSHTQ
jgi:hypothetical protein